MPVNLTTQSKVETWLTAPTKDALAGPIVSIVLSQIGEADVVVARQDATAPSKRSRDRPEAERGWIVIGIQRRKRFNQSVRATGRAHPAAVEPEGDGIAIWIGATGYGGDA